MKISYSMLTHNETDSLYKLIEFIVEHKDEEDEIVILDDYSDNEKTKEILDTMCSIHEIKFEQRSLNKDYGAQKNHLKNMCTGDYIFNLDADELPNKWLMKNIKTINALLNTNTSAVFISRYSISFFIKKIFVIIKLWWQFRFSKRIF